MSHFRLGAIIAVAFLTSTLSVSSFADSIPTLSIIPVSPTVGVGTTFAIDVNIAGVTDLYDFQFDLSFNPTVLQATSVLEGTFLSSGGTTFFIPGTIDNAAGTITSNADTLLTAISGVSGNGTLLLLDFTALTEGTSDLTISDVILQDSTGIVLTSGVTGGSVTVQGAPAVPEPTVLMLFLTELLVGATYVLAVRPRVSRNNANHMAGRKWQCVKHSYKLHC